MLKRVIQRINKILQSVKMAELLPSSTIGEQDNRKNKREKDEERSGKQKRQRDYKWKKRENEDERSDHQKRQRIEVDGKRVPKRKIAMLVGYNGKDYFGLQMTEMTLGQIFESVKDENSWVTGVKINNIQLNLNKGFRTIESDILNALKEVECIPEEHAEIPQKMSFQRSCRTDKGVSAVCNVLSMRINIDKLVEKINNKLPEQIKVFGYIRTTKGFDSKNSVDNRTYVYICPTYAFAPIETIVTDQYRITDDVVDQINKILQRYVGTHRFHNYTSQVKSTEARAKRYIISFDCGKPFVRDDCEYCEITVTGQSFMMHHIRKMIGMTIAIVRGNCGEDVIEKTWGPDRVDVPKAPGLGLCLEQPHYNNYNKKFGNDGIHEPLDWSEYKEEIEKFKEEFIYSDIMKTEREEKIMMQWLGALQNHQFDVVDDEEERNKRYSNKRKLDKLKDNPDVVITPDSKKMGKEENQTDSSQMDNKSENGMGDNSDVNMDMKQDESNNLTTNKPDEEVQTQSDSEEKIAKKAGNS